MLFKRLLLAIILAGVFLLCPARAQTPRAVLYASAGAELTQYDVDASGASLVKKGSVRLPANVQYAWQHPSRKYLYVAWSDGGAAAAAVGSAAPPSGKNHGVSAFRIDSSSGALQARRHRST